MNKISFVQANRIRACNIFLNLLGIYEQGFDLCIALTAAILQDTDLESKKDMTCPLGLNKAFSYYPSN
jgi:hypothetical protein